jgi:2-dehydropantoate 2-reductase
MKTKIVIVGLGGVGGYFGGMLAKYFFNNPEVEIYFLARGEHLRKVQKNGLTLVTETETFVIHPTLATDDIREVGIANYVIMSPKSYDLNSTIEQIKPCIGIDTVILPLLNGIDNSQRIRKLLPETEVWDGCCYIVAKILEDGVVENVGVIHRIAFGYLNRTSDQLLAFEKLLKDAGIEIRFYDTILTEIWKKFFFISTSASLTSFFDVSYGELLTDRVRRQTLIDFSTELVQVAIAEGATIDNAQIEKLILHFEKLPVGTTTSMHRDFQAKKNTEVDTLTGIVVELAHKHGIAVPLYSKVYNELKNRM